MDVTDVLRDRMHEPAGLQRMIGVSIGVHAVLIASMLIAPGQWLGRTTESSKNVMVITLGGGGEGPRNGGMTAMGGRPVQQVAPPQETPKREAVRPPAAKVPEMTLPTKNARPTKATRPAPSVYQAPEGSKGRTPTKGSQLEAGNAIAQTGARGQGFGLSTGGGPGTGSTLDVGDFCCPDYILLMVERIRSAWNQNQGAPGQVVVKFTIQRNGSITAPAVERSSGNSALDLAALRAVVGTRTLPPLPEQFPNPTLGVHLNFDYSR